MKEGIWKKRALCMLMCIVLLFALVPDAYAEGETVVTIDLSSVSEPGGTGYTYDSGTKVITITDSANAYTITGATTTSSVAVSGKGTFAITLSDVSITSTDNVPLNCADATVNLAISGSNSLENSSGAAIRVPVGASLTIGGSGSLTAKGGTGGAGIGGSTEEECGNIAIMGGTINAQGGESGAGIGGGFEGNGGTVVISGGSVYAIAGSNALPIGGGEGSASNGTLKDASGTDVYLTTVKLEDVSSAIAVTSLTVTSGGLGYAYGITGIATDTAGNLYLYLPDGARTTQATAGGHYVGDVLTTTDKNTSKGVFQKEFTVTFDSLGGSVVNSLTAKKGATIQEPSEPARSGFNFIGWYKDVAYTNAWNFTADTVQGDTTLYAKWAQQIVAEDDDNDAIDVAEDIPMVVVLYNVAFDSQGGSTVSSIWDGPGVKISEPAEPTRTNYVFGGWYKDKACKQLWDFASDTIPEHNITLYAKWLCKITAFPNNPDYGSVQGGGIYELHNLFSVTANPKDGYAFIQWEENGKMISLIKTYLNPASQNHTLMAVFKPLPAPSVKAVPASSSKLKVSWTAVSGAMYYEVYAAEVIENVVGNYTFRQKLTQLTFTDTGLRCSRTYSYRVRAVFTDRFGSVLAYGPYGTVSAVPRPIAPSVTAKCVDSKIIITWDAAEGANYYILYRQKPTEKNMYKILQTKDGNTRSYTYTSAPMGEKYVYVLRSYGSVALGRGRYSVESCSNPVMRIPGKPMLSAKRSSNRKKIDLSWTSAAQADRYEIYSAVKGGGFNMIKERYAIYHSWTNSGLDTKLSYWYKVRAYSYDAKGNKVYGEYSDFVEVP